MQVYFKETENSFFLLLYDLDILVAFFSFICKIGCVLFFLVIEI